MGCVAATWVVCHRGYRLWVMWVMSFVVWGGLVTMVRWWHAHVGYGVGYGFWWAFGGGSGVWCGGNYGGGVEKRKIWWFGFEFWFGYWV